MRVLLAVACVASFACGSSGSGGGEATVVSIEILPANATIESDGTPVSLAYSAIAHYEDGHSAPILDAVFTLDDAGSVLGEVAATELTAHGRRAGKGAITATSNDLVASTSFIVNVHPVRLGPGVPADGASKFPETSPQGAMSPTTVYPLDGAVMPASVKGPEVHWEGASGTDHLYRVRVTAGFATVDTILSALPGFTFHLDLSPSDWRLLIDSAGVGAIYFIVDHYDPANGAHGGQLVQVKIANADVTGVIYYWNLFDGTMERIDSAGRAIAIPNPQPSTSGDGVRCVACHTVSRDGRYLSATVGHAGEPGGVFDMSDPLVRTADPAPMLTAVTSTTYRVLFTTFNPDASRLLVNDNDSFSLIDPMTGTSIATNGTPLPATRASHPAWSPDGGSIAFISNIRQGTNATTWAVDYTHGDLAVIPASANDTFGAPITIVSNSTGDPAFASPSWPSFAPDSSWIAYGAGVHSRGKLGATENAGALFVVDKAGGPPRELANACGGARRCYLPNFSPFDSGGYYWLVFYSFRDWGNAQAGTKGTGRRQMWITAIDKAKLASGGDPSSIPYWVPDQDRLTENMSAFWAMPAPLL